MGLFPKIISFGFAGITTVLLLSPAFTIASPDVIEVIGECGEINCAILFSQLEEDWSKQIVEYKQECQREKRFGLNVYKLTGTTELRVSVICWEAEKVYYEDGTSHHYGNFWGVLPYPGYTANFGSEWYCHGDRTCDKIVMKLRALYPHQIREAEIACGMRQGFLHPATPPEWDTSRSENESEIDVTCGFFVPSLQVDDDGDGVSDGEGKPTSADFVIGRFVLGTRP